ncbi:hypothetical protein NDU88_003890 [Pleurodeles waltl]|uniref:Uncharacterized protein n=1 Tax=Pleurodeles waltl TaxID=8319 RepID=A0AAV7TPR9_PLEWA|nr:hypothetical protein NDU88_003890 [Pleurodeles waltl]
MGRCTACPTEALLAAPGRNAAPDLTVCSPEQAKVKNEKAAGRLHSRSRVLKIRGLPTSGHVSAGLGCSAHPGGVPLTSSGDPPRCTATQVPVLGRDAIQAVRWSVGSNQPQEPRGEPARFLRLTASPGSPFDPRLPPDTAKRRLKVQSVAEPLGFTTCQPCWLAPPPMGVFCRYSLTSPIQL